MNVSEACAVNDLLNWVLQRAPHEKSKPPSSAEAAAAAGFLAQCAHKRLMAGLSREDLEEGWGRSPAARLKRAKTRG